jgi:hypothetical protein
MSIVVYICFLFFLFLFPSRLLAFMIPHLMHRSSFLPPSSALRESDILGQSGIGIFTKRVLVLIF